MCCFCCGPKPCLCWLCMSIFASLVGIVLLGGSEVGWGGPFVPTFHWARAFKCTYVANSSAVLVCSGALLLLRPYGEPFLRRDSTVGKCIALLCINLGLLFSFGVTVYFICVVNQPITVKEVSEYTTHYYYVNQDPPPTIQWLQSLLKTTDSPSLSFGCCGGESFLDYVDELPPCNLKKPRTDLIQFEGPLSCCKRGQRSDPFCASNLNFLEHELRLRYMSAYLDEVELAPSTVNEESMGTRVRQKVSVHIATWMMIGSSTSAAYSPKYDCPQPVNATLMSLVVPNWKRVPYNVTFDVNGDAALEEKAVSARTTQRWDELIHGDQGIHVLGCARLLEVLLNDQKEIHTHADIQNLRLIFRAMQILITVLGAMKLLICFGSILVFNYYFFHFFICNAPHSEMENPVEMQRMQLLWQLTADRSHFPTSAKF